MTLLYIIRHVRVAHVRDKLLEVLEDFRLHPTVSKILPHVAVVSVVVVLPFHVLDRLYEMKGLQHYR